MAPTRNISRLLTAALLLMSAVPVHALPAITCHCFTDRSFDPARPTAADPFFLATVQNSFMAAAFGVDKKTIVLQKQKGVSPDDLWIAYRAASESRQSPDKLLQARQKAGWKEVLAAAGIPGTALGARASRALAADASSSVLAVEIVNDLLLKYRLLGETEMTALRNAGATNQEIIISALLAEVLKKPALQLFREVKSGNRSWGALLREAKLDPSGMSKYLEGRLKVEAH